ncbi:MAG: hypothetical protein ABSA68_13330 [Xanthobacteraceae bacterium]|jgi:hypothetical protein
MPMLDDDRLITPALLKRFMQEAALDGGNGQHYAFIRRDNGNLVGHNPYSPEIAGHQMMFADDVLKKLNRELHHDGAWVIVFTNPKRPAPGDILYAQGAPAEYGRYVLIWLDEDGDAQVPIEWVENESELLDFADVLTAGLEAIIQQCEAAWAMWHLHMRQVIEPREGETFKRAQGQQAPSRRH